MTSCHLKCRSLRKRHSSRPTNTPCTRAPSVGATRVVQGSKRKARNRAQLHPQRVFILGQRHRGHEWNLVLRPADGRVPRPDRHRRSAPRRATGTLFPLAHGGHQFVVHAPGGRVSDPELAHQCHRREPGLRLADKLDGENPRGQRQLGPLHHRTGRQRRLVAAGLALEALRPVVLNHAVRVCRTTTARAAKAVRPAGLLQRGCALFLAAILSDELRHRHSRLKLNPILGHGAPLCSGCKSSLRPAPGGGSGSEPAEDAC